MRFDSSDFVNPNQALVFGTIGIVLIDENTVMALPNTYDFDTKNKAGSFFRDLGTGFGSVINDIP